MLIEEKLIYLEKFLNKTEQNYADSFKSTIAIYLGDFEPQNPNLLFLQKLNSVAEIENWVNTLTSQIVLKFEEENEQLSDFIADYITSVARST
jgi:hypothetical protein